MKIVDFGFPEDKILGAFRTNCPGWKVKIEGAKCKVSWALRLVDEIYPYQLTADPLRRQTRLDGRQRGECWTFEERR